MADVLHLEPASADDLLAQAFPKSQHPVKAWRLVVRGEALWHGPEIGRNGRRPKIGPAGESYAEHVNRVANDAGYASGFGLSQVYDMMKRVKYLDRLDPGILDYIEGLPIPRRGLADTLDDLVTAKAPVEKVMQAVKDWLGERGEYAKPEKAEASAVERAVATLQALLTKLPVDTLDGKTFRAEALELLCAS